jgi:hypothetical protein
MIALAIATTAAAAAHALTIATASVLVSAAALRASYCARNTTAGRESEAIAEQEAAAAAAVATAQHLTRADIWRSHVDRQLAPPQLSDYAYLEAAVRYKRAVVAGSPKPMSAPTKGDR